MDADFEATLGLVDALLGQVDEHHASEFLDRIGELLRRASLPPDRAVRWAVLGDPQLLEHAEAALQVARSSHSELLRLVLDEPVMRHAAVVGVLTRAAAARPDAVLQSRLEVLARCADVGVEAAFEELPFVAAAYQCMIDRADAADLHRQLLLLQAEGEQRMSPWLLETALKIGAALLTMDPPSVVILNAITMYMLAAVHAAGGRTAVARTYVNAALEILERVSAVDPQGVLRPRRVALEIAGLIDDHAAVDD